MKGENGTGKRIVNWNSHKPNINSVKTKNHFQYDPELVSRSFENPYNLPALHDIDREPLHSDLVNFYF